MKGHSLSMYLIFVLLWVNKLVNRLELLPPRARPQLMGQSKIITIIKTNTRIAIFGNLEGKN